MHPGLTFPDVDVPEGWSARDAGPRRWLLPPGVTEDKSGARIVLVPLLRRKAHIGVRELMEETLRADLSRFPHMRKTPFEELQATSGLAGLRFELAILKDAPAGEKPEAGDVREWRACAAFADDAWLYSTFLQAYPGWYERTVGIFWTVARSVKKAS